MDDNNQAQRAIFQLLDVHVILNHCGEDRWADVIRTLGCERCAMDYPIMKSVGADNLIPSS